MGQINRSINEEVELPNLIKKVEQRTQIREIIHRKKMNAMTKIKATLAFKSISPNKMGRDREDM